MDDDKKEEFRVWLKPKHMKALIDFVDAEKKKLDKAGKIKSALESSVWDNFCRKDGTV
jgi:hypothetical protein